MIYDFLSQYHKVEMAKKSCAVRSYSVTVFGMLMLIHCKEFWFGVLLINLDGFSLASS